MRQTNLESPWQGKWIWAADGIDVVNYHCQARRRFTLDAAPITAILRLTVGTDYVLYVNGVFVGRGPTPSDPAFQSYDSYDISARLQSGENVIALLCHNYAVGTHWQYGGPGGLIAELEIESPIGRVIIATDEKWVIRAAKSYVNNSPRAFWSCGFVETFDFRQHHPDWVQPGYDDRDWPVAGLLPHKHARRFQRLVPREIPPLREEPAVAPVAAEAGQFALRGFHAVAFDGVIPCGENHLGYAQTWFYTPEARDVIAVLESDDAVRFTVNDDVIFNQSYNDIEVATKLWRGSDEYEQVHYGMHLGYSGERRPVRLNAGWNKALVVVDQGPAGWGFTLRWLDPATRALLDLPFAADRADRRACGRGRPIAKHRPGRQPRRSRAGHRRCRCTHPGCLRSIQLLARDRILGADGFGGAA